jgi:hypothetical protein
MISDVVTTIKPRVDSQGRRFTEIFYEFWEHGLKRNACSRTWADIPDSPMARAQETQAFTRRQARPYSDGSMP